MRNICIFAALIFASTVIALAVDVHVGSWSDLTWTGSGTTRTGQFTTVTTTTTTTQPGWSDTTPYAYLIESETTNAAGNWLDTSGNNLTSTNTGSLFYIAGTNQNGRVEHSIRMDGSDDMTAGPPPVLNTNAFSVMCWFYFDDVADAKCLVNMWDWADSSGTKGAFHLGTLFSDYNDLQFAIGTPVSAGGAYVYTAGDFILATNWYFVCATYTSQTASIYINGQIKPVTTNAALPVQCAGATHQLRLGHFQGVGRFLDGEIDHAAVRNGVVSSNEQYQIYLNTHPTNNLRIRP